MPTNRALNTGEREFLGFVAKCRHQGQDFYGNEVSVGSQSRSRTRKKAGFIIDLWIAYVLFAL